MFHKPLPLSEYCIKRLLEDIEFDWDHRLIFDDGHSECNVNFGSRNDLATGTRDLYLRRILGDHNFAEYDKITNLLKQILGNDFAKFKEKLGWIKVPISERNHGITKIILPKGAESWAVMLLVFCFERVCVHNRTEFDMNKDFALLPASLQQHLLEKKQNALVSQKNMECDLQRETKLTSPGKTEELSGADEDESSEMSAEDYESEFSFEDENEATPMDVDVQREKAMFCEQIVKDAGYRRFILFLSYQQQYTIAPRDLHKLPEEEKKRAPQLPRQ